MIVDSLLEIITERRSQKFYKSIDVHSMTNAIEEIVVSMVFKIFLVVIFFVGWVVTKLKGRVLFSDWMNGSLFDITLSRRERNCCIMENLKYLLCCKRNILIKPCRITRTFFKTKYKPCLKYVVYLPLSC